MLSPEALSDVKQAVEVLEYALNVTNGIDRHNIVPITVRNQLIKTWVLAIGLMNQALPRNYGHDNDAVDSQGPMSKALCVLQALLIQSRLVA